MHTKKSNRPGTFYLKESAADLIQGNSGCGEERKNLTIQYAKISKKRMKIMYRSPMYMLEKCRKEMGKVFGSIHEVKRFYLFFWTMPSIFENAWKFLSILFPL